ncbi:MAG: reprolysin-like metallopeptidase [Saprospiraceae bacterium]
MLSFASIFSTAIAQTQDHFLESEQTSAGLTDEALVRYNELSSSSLYTSVALVDVVPLHKSVNSDGEIQLADPENLCPKFLLQAQSVQYSGSYDYEWSGFDAGSDADDECDCQTRQYTEIRTSDGLLATLRIDDRGYHIEEISSNLAAICKFDPDANSVNFCGVGSSEDNGGDYGEATNTDISLDQRTDNYCPVDVLFISTQTVADSRDLGMLSSRCIQDFNHIARNSRINNRDLKLRRVGLEIIPFTPTGNGAFDLAALRAAGGQVDLLRAASGADIVVYMHDRAYGGALGAVSAIAAAANLAYLHVDVNTAVGDIPVFAHEAGHIFGARHSVDSDQTPGAMHSKGIWKCWKRHNTTVVEGGAGGVRIPYFSNPNIQYRGKTIGSTARENASATIRGAACGVSAFRAIPQVPAFSGQIVGPNWACPGHTVVVSTEINTAPLGTITYQWFSSLDGINYSQVPSQSTNGWTSISVPFDYGDVVFVRVLATASDGSTLQMEMPIGAECDDDHGGNGPQKVSSSSTLSHAENSNLSLIKVDEAGVLVELKGSPSNPESIPFIVTDSSGKIVANIKGASFGETYVPLSNIPQGLYFLSTSTSINEIGAQTIKFLWAN